MEPSQLFLLTWAALLFWVLGQIWLVQIVVYPPAKSFYELITEFTSISQRTALTGWLSADELQTIRALRRSHALFRRGEPLALMPFTFVR